MRRLLGVKNLVHDFIERTTNLVEETHEAAARRPIRVISKLEPLGETARAASEVAGAVDEVRRAATAPVYETIRQVSRAIRALEDVGVEMASKSGLPAPPELRTPLASTAMGSLSWWADAAQGALNGAIGDFLSERGNGLEVPMEVRAEGQPVALTRDGIAEAFPDATDKLCVFVHGLGCTEWSWSFLADRLHGDARSTFGTMLRRDLGYTPAYVRYNTGLHISDNGKRLAALIEALVACYPRPVREVVVIGHSMGGLVARSAVHYGAEHRQSWTRLLTHVFCIGSPHLGAPLEKAGNMLASVLMFFETAGTQVPAKILNGRSAGIKDLRFGYVVEEDWKDRAPDALLEDNRHDVPFVDWVTYCFVASTITRDPNDPLGDFLGDVLVRPGSAAGRHPEPARRIPFHMGATFGGLHHLEIMNHPDVYAEIRRWIETTKREVKVLTESAGSTAAAADS